MKVKINKITIRLIHEDLRAVPADGFVNVTDTNLHLDPDIARRVGTEVERELSVIGWCEVGGAVITQAGKMPFKHIIHAVGPRWGEGSERGKLANATLECLRLAESNGLRSLALPAISTGAFGYPLENCARTMLTQIVDFTFEELRSLKTIVVCLIDDIAYDVFKAELERQIEELRESDEGQVQV